MRLIMTVASLFGGFIIARDTGDNNGRNMVMHTFIKNIHHIKYFDLFHSGKLSG